MELTILNRGIPALLDSGSSVSVLPWTFARHIPPDKICHTSMPALIQTQGQVKFNAKCILEARIGSVTGDIPFFLLSSPLPYAIISCDHMGFFDLHVDFRSMEITQCGRHGDGRGVPSVVPIIGCQDALPDMYDLKRTQEYDKSSPRQTHNTLSTNLKPVRQPQNTHSFSTHLHTPLCKSPCKTLQHPLCIKSFMATKPSNLNTLVKQPTIQKQHYTKQEHHLRRNSHRHESTLNNYTPPSFINVLCIPP